MSKKKGDGSVNDIMEVQAGSIRSGGYCILEGFPCLVTAVSMTKSKALIVGTDLFTNKKYDYLFATSGIVIVPGVQTAEFEVADIDEDEFVSLVEDDGSLKTNLKVPKDESLNAELMKIWNSKADTEEVKFTVLKSYGEEKIISAKIINTQE